MNEVVAGGPCGFWDSKPFIEAANILVAADEPLRALKLLKELPGFYRDNQPPEIHALIRKIHQYLATPVFYAGNFWDTQVQDVDKATSALDGLLRGILIRQDVEKYNQQKITPHIIDLGPGEYWLPIALSHKGFHFTYQGVGLCKEAEMKARALLPGHIVDKKPAHNPPTIFVACELIEHLHNENDILVEFERNQADAEIIHVSTPKYTYDTKADQIEWENKGCLGHLRTYTPKEFQDVVQSMFTGYNWGYCDSYIMHLRGTKNKI